MSAQATRNTGGNMDWPLASRDQDFHRVMRICSLYCWQCGCFDCSDDQSFYLQNEPSEPARQSLRVPDLSCPSVAEWSDPGTRRPGLCTPLIDLYPACTSPVGGFEPRHWFVDFNLARVQRLQILLCTYRSGNIYKPGLDRFYQFNPKDWTFPSDKCNPILDNR